MSRFTPIMELVESLCLRTGDILMRNKGLYLDCSEDVFSDLNETTLRIAERVKIPVRRLFQINKRTNSIDLPPNHRLSSVNVIDRASGVIYPVFRNDRLHDDIVDIGNQPNCACAYACGYKMCNTIKGYEVIFHTENDHLPNGDAISFDCTDKKTVVGNILYAQLQYPQRIYHSGIWVDTVLHTENKKMCEVEVDKNGCVCDTEQNINSICNACGIGANNEDQCCIGGTASTPPNEKCTTWQYYCSSKADWLGVQCGQYPYFRAGCANIYNISELGDRLIFPSNFGWEFVLVRFYADITLDNMEIPYMARETFMTGLQYYASTNNPKKIQEAAIFAQKYSRQKWGLFLELNKYRIAELRMMTTPPVFVPSYFDWKNSGYNNNW